MIKTHSLNRTVCLGLVLFLSAHLTSLESQSILISEVSLCTNQVELYNSGLTMENIASWQLCNRNAASGGPFYTSVSSVAGGANTLLAPGDYITLTWSKIEGPTGELGLYINSSFSDPGSIHDYMQFNAGNNIRASVAVTAGVWDDASAFVIVDDMAGCNTVIANAAGPSFSNSTTWCTPAMNTIGSTNSLCAEDMILISEVSLCTNDVELYNAGLTTVDIAAWQLCNRNAASGGPFYTSITSVAAGANTTLAPGDYITLNWNKIEGPTGELGLYINSSFANPASIHDYMQFNAGNNARAGVAVSAGVWDDASAFVTVDDMSGCATVIANAADPTSSNSTTWCTAASNTLGSANSSCLMTSSCPDDYANGGSANSMPSLTGTQTVDADFETDGAIISNQQVGPDVMVDYDSGTSIELLSGFVTLARTTFHAFIDGCNGSMFIEFEAKQLE